MYRLYVCVEGGSVALVVV